MTSKASQPENADDLRRQAEEKAAQSPENLESLSPEETQQTLHELRVHQIELEMQNEELRRAQRELEAARTRYSDLYDLAPVGYVTLSEQGLILEANLTAATLLGVTRGDLVKQPLSRFIFLADEDIYYLHCKHLFETGNPQECELRMSRVDADPFWAILEATAAHDDDGVFACRAAISDISERKRAEAEVQVVQEKLLAEQRRGQRQLRKLNRELECRNRELQDFVQVASHDLRSPLVNIRGFGDLLVAACDRARNAVARIQDAEALRAELLPLLEEQIPESLDFIRAGSTKMNTLLAGLLNLSRMGSAALTIERLDMNRMIAEIVASMKFSLEQAGATVQLDALPPCYGDAVQLSQVFSNLLDNALKYLDPDRPGLIRVFAHQKRNEVLYCVKDNGLGIAAEHQEVIFRLFHRLNTDRGDGQGLGLTIVRRVLDRQGGKIRLESAPNQGSTFFVSLPSKPLPDSTRAKRHRPSEPKVRQ